jgi:imidazolonepropionase-like amidohydrolase
MGWSDEVGTIEADKFGDLIAVKGDPLADITLLQKVEVVLKGGMALKLPGSQSK